MKTVQKVCAAVIRHRPTGPELLVFSHPTAGVQIPKGSLDASEPPQEGVLRELHEETGIEARSEPRYVGSWERHAGAGPTESGPVELHIWDVFVIDAPRELPDAWVHEAWGSEAESGLTFACHWIPLDDGCADVLHPLFGPVVQMIRAAVLA